MPTQLPLTAYGLLGQPEQGGGLLDPRNMAMLSAAASLLEGGGPSLTPTSLGQNLGRAAMTGLQSYQMGQQQAVQNALMKRNLLRQDKADARQEKLDQMSMEDRQRQIQQQQQEQARADQLRQLFPSAFNEDGSVNPSAIRDIAAVSPSSAQTLAGMVPKTVTEPKYQLVDATLPDGRTVKGRIDLNAPNPEATFMPVGSPKTDPIPAESAAKKAAVDQGIALIPEIRQRLFDDKGDLRESVVADTPFVSLNQARRELEPMILSAVEAILRAESGAAVPEEEVKRAAKRYIPSILDSDAAARKKIDLLEDRLNRSQEAFEVGRPGSRTTDTMGGWSIQVIE